MESNKSELEELVLDESFQDYVIDNLNEEFWLDWTSKNPGKSELFEDAKSIVRSLRINGREVPESEIDEEIAKFEKRIDNGNIQTSARVVPLWKTLARVAAVLIIGGFVSFVYFNQLKTDNQSVAQVEKIVKETPLGVKTEVRLPDGTRVKLNSGSVLKYPAVFSENLREVELTGEAFFQVVEKKSKPFVVNTSNFKTTVLGTSFSIRSYDETTSKVSLMEGSVKVSTEFTDRILEPGQQAIYSPKPLTVLEYDYNEEFGWKDGILNFSNDDAKSIFNKLQRWYGVDIKFDSPNLPVLEYSGYYKNEDLETVIKGLSYSLKFNYEINGKTVKIKFN